MTRVSGLSCRGVDGAHFVASVDFPSCGGIQMSSASDVASASVIASFMTSIAGVRRNFGPSSAAMSAGDGQRGGGAGSNWRAACSKKATVTALTCLASVRESVCRLSVQAAWCAERSLGRAPGRPHRGPQP